jgi:mevalonate kinase
VRNFPSKILLFGEYGILLGSNGIAMPYPFYSGQLVHSCKTESKTETEKQDQSNRHLNFLFDYLRTTPHTSSFLKLHKFREELSSGLFFNSNIPQAYGLGSSGALTAAVFDRYAKKAYRKKQLSEIRSMLAVIEKFFHGTSSGLDPLVSWTNAAILIEQNGLVKAIPDINGILPPPGHKSPSANENIESTLSGTGIFIVDTKTEGRTGNLVEWFQQQYRTHEFRKAVDDIYLPAINQAVTALLNNNINLLIEATRNISEFQITHLRPMIPAHFYEFFKEGSNTGEFYIKLCGSGGGGFMLGITRNREATFGYFHNRDFPIRFLF